MAKRDGAPQADDLLAEGALVGDADQGPQGADVGGEAADKVEVVLNCILSGYPGDPGPGAVVAVDPDEAVRLVDELGVAQYADQ